MKRVLIAAILKFALLGLVSSASGQVHQVTLTRRDCSDRANCRYISLQATCVCVGRQDGEYIYLTAGHVLRDATSLAVVVDGRVVPARAGAWYCDASGDIGFLHARHDGNQTYYRIADDVPPIGSPIGFMGLKNNRIDYEKSRLVECKYAGENIVFETTNVHGQSGGPVFFNGMVIGIMSAQARPGTLCSNCRAIRRFARQHRYRLPPSQGAPEQDAPTPLPRPQVSGHDARPAVGAGCECGAECRCEALSGQVSSLSDQISALSGERDRLRGELETKKGELAALENQRRQVQFKTFTGQTGRANILVKRNGGTFVESLSSDGSVADSAEYAAGEPIRFDVVQVPRKE